MQKPSKHIQQAVLARLAHKTDSAVAAELGVCRTTVAKVAAGLPIYDGTLALLTRALGASASDGAEGAAQP